MCAIDIQQVSRPDDRRLDDYRLGEGALERSRGVFIAEGRLVVRRIIESHGLVVRSVLVSPTALQQLGPVFEELPGGTPVFVCAPADFLGITGYNIHRGCLAVVERPPEQDVNAVLAGVRLVVATEAIANPDNIGGIFRSAAAFAAGGVLLDAASCDPLYRKAVRTSMGATLSIPFARLLPWPERLRAVKEHGFALVALTPRSDAEPLPSFARCAHGLKIALLLGTEGAGLSDSVMSMADHRVRIEIDGAVDSLNVAVAAGIALHALR